MASLTGNLVAETYKALLKTIDNDILTASEKQITDGFGGGSNVFIDSNGFLRANKYKVTNGLATQFLKADGSLDTNTYLTSITGAQVITALGFTPVPTTRTITINGETHNLAANNTWTIGGTAAIWGNITGTLSNQTDLQTALNAKFDDPTGTISQYIRGDGSIANFPSIAGGLPTGGTAGQILSKIDSTNYNAEWIDNFATQTKNEVKLGQTLTKGTAVYVSSANGTNMIVSAASNVSEALSSKTFGLLETGGATNAFVKCVTFGLLAGLDTSTASAGDPVWLGVNGALIFGLANKPYAPAHLVYIGVVTRVNSNNGEIFVNVQNGFELKEIHDVSAQSPTNNDGLFYESSTGLWKNKSIATVLGYTPQAQLSGTGFVKASGTTITYDNSTYLTTSVAESTYQRLDKMVSNLLASATEYPNSNAVIAALALKANAENPVFTGNMTISGAEPKLFFTDTDNNPDYTVFIDSGIFYIYDQTNGATRFSIGSTGNISAGVGKSITAGSFVKESGTAAQFLKADGSIDSSTYVTSASLANYLLITTAASTYQRLDKMVSNLLASDTEYPNSNAVLAKLALKADAANPVFTGDLSISGATPRLYFVDTDQNPDYTIFVDSGYFYIYDQTAGATKFQITPSGNAINTGTLTSASFIKSGGTSSQYLMADGSVTTGISNPVGGTGTTNYLPKWTSGSVIDNSVIYELNSKIHIGTTTESSYKLEVNAGTAGGISVSNAAAVLSLNLYNSTNNTIARFTSTTNAFWDLQANTDGTFQIDRSDSAVITFSTSGNVLINTQADSGYKLDVSGQIRSYSSSSLILAQSSVAANDAVVAARWSSTSGIEMRYNPDIALTNFDSLYPATSGQVFGDIRFRVNAGGVMTPVMTIKANGTNVGIGTTSPTEKLHVYSSATTGEIRLGGGNGAGNARMYFQAHATTAYIDMYGNNSYLPMQINANPLSFMGGYVGVNTSSPSAYLHINGSSYGTGLLITTSSISGADITLTNTGSGGKRWDITSGGSNNAIGAGGLQFYNETDGAMRLGITSGGNVLMRTTTSSTTGGFTNTTLLVKQVADGGAGGGLQIEASGSDNVAFFGFDGSSFKIGTSYRTTGSYQPIDFSTNGPVRMRIANSGNLLLGTTTDSGWKFYINGGGTDALKLYNSGGVQSMNIENTTNNVIMRLVSSTNTFWDIQANTNGTFHIDRGDVTAFLLATSGAATFSSSVTGTAFFESSDFRLKKLIEHNPIVNGIENLEAKLYEKNGKLEIGYFAQDAEKLMPYAVEKNADGFLTLSYREVHTAKIARLEQRVAELEKQLNAA